MFRGCRPWARFLRGRTKRVGTAECQTLLNSKRLLKSQLRPNIRTDSQERTLRLYFLSLVSDYRLNFAPTIC